MNQVKFTQALKRFFPDLHPVEISGKTVKEIIEGLNEHFPGMKDYVVDEQGSLRQHVNIFIGEDLIKDKVRLGDPVGQGQEIYIMQALSGG